MASRKLTVEIVGDASSLQKALGQAQQHTSAFQSGLQKASKVAVGVFAGIGAAAVVGFKEISDGQKVMAQTNAVLSSTGNIANVTAKHVDGLASSLSKVSGVDDEAIASGENLLLTFTRIRNEVGKGNDIFDQATKTVLDMSVALKEDMKSASIQVGKALQDPIKGVGALQRVGVSFTAGQKEQIKALVESGKTMEAQKLILGELNREFGGSAKAAGETLPGQLNKARNAFEEMSANVVVVLLPALTQLAQVTARVADFMSKHTTAVRAAVAVLGTLAGIVLAVNAGLKVYAAFQTLAAAATGAWTAAQWLLNAALTANPIGVVVVALGALVAGLVLAYKHSETFRRIVTGAFDAVKGAATAVLNFFRDNWKVIAALISGPFAPVVLLATDAFGIRSALVGAANAILDFFRSNWKTIATIISGPFAPLVALATDAFGIRSALVGAFHGIVEGVREQVSALVRVVRGIPGRIVDALGALDRLLYGAGVAVVQGLINGIEDKLGDLWRLVGSIPGKLKGLFTAPLGIGSPSKVMANEVGKPIVEGIMAGIGSRLPDLDRLVGGIAPKIAVNTVGGAMPRVAAAGITTPALPAGASLGGGTAIVVHNHIAGSVVTEEQLTDVVRRNLLRFSKRNGRSAL